MPIPSEHEKPTRKTAKENALDALLLWIIDGTLRPGEKLNDIELAEALGVSRTPIRESLQLLEVEGFVKMLPGKATQVTEVDPETINDLLPPLAALQALSAELAVPHLTKETLEELEQTNEEFAQAVYRKDDYTALRLDENFHQIIVDIAANPYIHSMVASLQKHVRRLFFLNSIILTEKSIDEHREIIQMMKEGNAEAVSKVMRENWLRAIEEFRSFKKD